MKWQAGLGLSPLLLGDTFATAQTIRGPGLEEILPASQAPPFFTPSAIIDNPSANSRGRLELVYPPAGPLPIIKVKIAEEATPFDYPVPELVPCRDSGGKWDRMRREQVITNLLTNAIRYGNRNPVRVVLESNAYLIGISIEDQGSGISEEAKPLIFDRFERAVYASEISGLGKGSRFVIELPKEQA